MSYHGPKNVGHICKWVSGKERNELLAEMTFGPLAAKLSPAETRSFLAHCLQLSKRDLPPELVEYVHRVSAGFLTYVALTARQLLHHGAILIETTGDSDVEDDDTISDLGSEVEGDTDLSDEEDPDISNMVGLVHTIGRMTRFLIDAEKGALLLVH